MQASIDTIVGHIVAARHLKELRPMFLWHHELVERCEDSIRRVCRHIGAPCTSATIAHCRSTAPYAPPPVPEELAAAVRAADPRLYALATDRRAMLAEVERRAAGQAGMTFGHWR